ncbi:MAG TPA: dTDP-4-dehydrorhamnose 3,5-epimerase [Longimicrobiaceae bacterium]
MMVLETAIQGVLVIQPTVFQDSRGYFLETWSRPRYEQYGIPGTFAQDNVSSSRKGVLRGLHFQDPNPQGKLVTVLHGSVWDVAVDLRPGSPTFGRWVGHELSAENARQVWIPEGFAHGFVVLSDEAVFSYKCTGLYQRDAEHSLRWNDPDLGIEWPVAQPLLSLKDAEAPLLRELNLRDLRSVSAGAGGRS